LSRKVSRATSNGAPRDIRYSGEPYPVTVYWIVAVKRVPGVVFAGTAMTI
jgi:hypothetical protein